MTTPAKPTLVAQLQSSKAPVDTLGREVERALHGSSHCGLRAVRCHFTDGSVTLSGEVASYYLKQIAQTIVGRLPYVQRVHNQLCVVGPYRRVDDH